MTSPDPSDAADMDDMPDYTTDPESSRGSDAAVTEPLTDNLYPHRGGWRHAVWCSWERGSEADCTCGLDDVRRALVAPKAPEVWDPLAEYDALRSALPSTPVRPDLTAALAILRAELVSFAEPYDGADPSYQRGKQYGLQLAIGGIDSLVTRAEQVERPDLRETLIAAIRSYDGPLDVSLPMNPGRANASRAAALADHLLARQNVIRARPENRVKARAYTRAWKAARVAAATSVAIQTGDSRTD